MRFSQSDRFSLAVCKQVTYAGRTRKAYHFQSEALLQIPGSPQTALPNCPGRQSNRTWREKLLITLTKPRAVTRNPKLPRSTSLGRPEVGLASCSRTTIAPQRGPEASCQENSKMVPVEKMKRASQGLERRNSLDSSGDSEPLSQVDLAEDEEWEDLESDTEESSFLSLVDDERFPRMDDMFEHVKARTSIDFPAICEEFGELSTTVPLQGS